MSGQVGGNNAGQDDTIKRPGAAEADDPCVNALNFLQMPTSSPLPS